MSASIPMAHCTMAHMGKLDPISVMDRTLSTSKSSSEAEKRMYL
jgi:hypothetical protein